jgi:VanZ family protein
MKWLPRQPKFWLTCFILWFISLWILSSFAGPGQGLPPIVNIDKVAHFGYFFGGSGLLSAYLFRRSPLQTDWKRLFVIVVSIIAAIAVLDEFHQSFTPGRSGNDPFDGLADLAGAAVGVLVFKRLHHLMK